MKEDWVECRLGDVINIVSGKNQSNVTNPNGKYPIYGSGGIIGRADDYLCEEYTTIIGRKGTINSPIFVKEKFWNVDTAFGLSSYDILNKKILYFFCIYFDFKKIDKSTTIPSLSKHDILLINFPLPPLPIQRAIVSKIETLFTSLDKGIADLKTAQEQLKIYRQAVLKKAFEGELTRKWREDIALNGNKLPTADELLEEIKLERKTYYENQLKEWEADIKKWEKNGKKGSKPGKPKRPLEFSSLLKSEVDGLMKLPNGWKWEKLGNICKKIMDGTHFSPKSYPTGKYKYITAKNIKEGRIDLKDISYLSEEDHREIYSKCDVKKDDVLYIKDGATTGRATVNKLVEEFSLLSSVCVFRTYQNITNSKFLEYFLNAEINRNKMLSNIAGVAITRLTLIKLNNSFFSLPSLPEQNQIVLEIEKRLSVCDKLEESISESLEKAKALRQSILKKAFDGTLLTPNEVEACKKEKDYEPASELLKKIKLEKENIV